MAEENQSNEVEAEPMLLPTWRNPAFNGRGTIDIEIQVGEAWWPFTASPDDVDERGRLLHAAVMAAGDIAPCAPPSPDELQTIIVLSVQQRLDTFAQTRKYDNILSAATYAGSTIPQFALEGSYAVQIRDATWAKLYQMLAEVEAGTRPIPAAYDEIETELPALEWP